MTKYVCPVKYNAFDKENFTDFKIDRRYRVDRPKDVTEHLKAGINSI
jgi:hypothetical protein